MGTWREATGQRWWCDTVSMQCPRGWAARIPVVASANSRHRRGEGGDSTRSRARGGCTSRTRPQHSTCWPRLLSASAPFSSVSRLGSRSWPLRKKCYPTSVSHHRRELPGHPEESREGPALIMELSEAKNQLNNHGRSHHIRTRPLTLQRIFPSLFSSVLPHLCPTFPLIHFHTLTHTHSHSLHRDPQKI